MRPPRWHRSAGGSAWVIGFVREDAAGSGKSVIDPNSDACNVPVKREQGCLRIKGDNRRIG